MNIPVNWKPPLYDQEKAQYLRNLYVDTQLQKEIYREGPFLIMPIKHFSFPKNLNCTYRGCQRKVIWWTPITDNGWCEIHSKGDYSLYHNKWLVVRYVIFLHSLNLLDGI